MKRVVVVLLCSVTLTGCAAGEGDLPAGTPTRSVSASPSPTAAPTTAELEAPAVKPLLSELVVSPYGLGPIVFGEAFDGAGETSPLVWDETYCDFDAATLASGAVDYPQWKANYPEAPFDVVTRDFDSVSPVRYIVVWSPDLVTAEGIGRGSSLDDVIAAYGSELVEIPNDYYPGYALAGPAGRLIFWMTPEVVALMTIEPIGTEASMPMHGGCT